MIDAAELIAHRRRCAGLSQRELAQRAGTSAAAICWYEQGERVPRVDTLARIIAATGASLELVAAAPTLDVEANGRDLAQLLELADHLPRRATDHLDAPVFVVRGATVTLTEQILELHRRLHAAGLPHAFGGALALAFCTAEPRATKDVDVNVFVPPSRVDDVLDALGPDVVATPADRTRLERDGQSRLWWDRTPVDVFLSNHAFHDDAERRSRVVPFAGVDLPVLACADLAVFKSFFARPKDVVDIATMAAAETVDLDALEVVVTGLLADDRRGFFRSVRGARREIARGR